MPRRRDRFLLSSRPDNPAVGPAERIRKEKRKGGKRQMWARGEKIPSGEGGQRERRSEERRSVQRQPIHPARSRLPGLGMNEIYCPLK